MKFLAEINVMPLKALLDPQGKAVTSSMNNNGFANVANVRIGKHITMEIEANSSEDAGKVAEDACKKILSNPIMEGFEYIIKQL